MYEFLTLVGYWKYLFLICTNKIFSYRLICVILANMETLFRVKINIKLLKTIILNLFSSLAANMGDRYLNFNKLGVKVFKLTVRKHINTYLHFQLLIVAQSFNIFSVMQHNNKFCGFTILFSWIFKILQFRYYNL